MVFQEPDNQIVGTIVEEDVAFGPENLGLPRAELLMRVRQALEQVGLWEERRRAPHLLSAGQKQRLAIAGVLAMQPRGIVLDEATTMLDPAGRAEALVIARRLRQQGVAIIAITHFMDEALEADRVIVLAEGQIALSGAPQEIFSDVERLRALRLELPPAARLAEAVRRRRPALPAGLLTASALVEAVDRLAGRRRQSPASPCHAERSEASREPLPGEPLIAVNDLHYTYLPGTPLETVALRGAQLIVLPGEIIGVIGRAGAGKSTLLQHLNGLLRPAQRGCVMVAGRDLAEPATDLRWLRQTVGLVLQRPEKQLFERLVGDDIAYGPRQMGLSRPEIRQRVIDAMRAVGLDFERFVDRPIAALSGGERRKVALAGVLALRPRVLVLDEATAGLDPLARQEFWEQMRRMNAEEGLTLILVSSEMEEVAALAQRVYVMAEGRTVAEGAPADLFADEDALRAWGLGQPATSATLSALRRRGYAVNPRALNLADAVEELCKILPS